MELPDFDTLKELAASEPSRLDAILEQQIHQLMAQRAPISCAVCAGCSSRLMVSAVWRKTILIAVSGLPT